jgi:acyl-CoA thioesterase FadM
MSGPLSRWSVGLDRTVEPADLDPDGYVTAQTLQTWLEQAADAYLAQCTELHALAAGRRLVRRPGRQPRASLLGRTGEVLVTASATEVRPTEFFISIRVRPFGGEVDLPLNVTCRVSIEDVDTGEPVELGKAVRDELIALEHAAEYMS